MEEEQVIVTSPYPAFKSSVVSTEPADEARRNIEQRIYDLKSQLTSNASDVGDWKICKCYEFALLGLPAPYDVAELNQKRQAIRDEINELQAQLDAESI